MRSEEEVRKMLEAMEEVKSLHEDALPSALPEYAEAIRAHREFALMCVSAMQWVLERPSLLDSIVFEPDGDDDPDFDFGSPND